MISKKLEIRGLEAIQSQRKARNQLLYIDDEIGNKQSKIIKIIFFSNEQLNFITI
jgi:hypothetical protein